MSAAPGPPDLSRLRIAPADREPAPVPTTSKTALVVVAALAALVAASLAWWARGASTPAPAATDANSAQSSPTSSPTSSSSSSSPSSAPPVDVAGAILAGGRVESSERRELAFAQAGIVAAVKVTRGQAVKAGELLVQLDDANERADVADKRAAVDAAAARLAELREGARPEELEQAQREVEAAQALATDADEKAAQMDKLLARGAATRAEAAQAKNNADAARARLQSVTARYTLLSRGARKTSVSTAEAELARARAALLQAEARLQAQRLIAPSAGTVVDVRVRTGEATGAVAQTPAAVVITDLAHLEVKVDVPEGKATRVHPGDKASITVEALADARFNGRVVDVGLEADRQKGTLEVTVAFDDGSDLSRVRPRMAARVAIDPNTPH